MIPEGPPCVPKMSLNYTKLSLGTFQAHKEPYYVLEMSLGFTKLGPCRGPSGPCVVPKMSAGGLLRTLGPERAP